MPKIHQCSCSDYRSKDLQEQVRELEFLSRSGHTLLQLLRKSGAAGGEVRVPLTKPAFGPAFPPGSALQRARKRRTCSPGLESPESGHGAFRVAILSFKTY